MHKRKKTRKAKIAEKQKERNKKKPFNKNIFLVYLLFFVGGGFTLMEIFLYRNTMIKWYIPFSIWLIVGITVTLICFKIWNTDLKNSQVSNIGFWLTFYNCLTFGGIAIFIFIYINFKSADSNIETHKLRILRKSTLKGKPKRIPLVDVKYKGLLKTIVFPTEDKIKIEDAKYIKLTTKKGNFGFDVILEKEIFE